MRLVPAFTKKAWARWRESARRLPPESARPHFLLLALDSVSDAVAAIDRQGRVIYCNSRFEELLGDVPLATPLAGWLLARGLEDSVTARVLQGEAYAEATARLKSPAAMSLRLSARPVLAPNGLVLGAVLVLREVVL